MVILSCADVADDVDGVLACQCTHAPLDAIVCMCLDEISGLSLLVKDIS